MSAAEDATRETLVTATKDEVIDELPDEDEAIESGEAVLEFTGQAWIEGRARDVDNKETTFTVPLSDLQVRGNWALDDTSFRHFVDDQLLQHENAPEWVQTWSGPFEIQVKTFST